MKLSIKSLLNSSLITSEQISLDCNIKYEDIRKLTAGVYSINDFSYIIRKNLYEYYKSHKQTLTPIHTYLIIQNKFDIHNGDSDTIFLDFFETKNEVIKVMGEYQFKVITDEDLNHQDIPFFLLEYSDKHMVFHISEFENLITHLQIIKPTNHI